MKNEAVKIIGLVVFFFAMGVMVGYKMRAQQPQLKAHVMNEVVTVIPIK